MFLIAVLVTRLLQEDLGFTTSGAADICQSPVDAKATGRFSSRCNQDAEAVAFYEFTRTTECCKFISAENTALALSTDSELFIFPKGMSPDIGEDL